MCRSQSRRPLSLKGEKNTKDPDFLGKAYHEEMSIIKNWVRKNMELMLMSLQLQFVFKKSTVSKRLIKVVKD